MASSWGESKPTNITGGHHGSVMGNEYVVNIQDPGGLQIGPSIFAVTKEFLGYPMLTQKSSISGEIHAYYIAYMRHINYS